MGDDSELSEPMQWDNMEGGEDQVWGWDTDQSMCGKCRESFGPCTAESVHLIFPGSFLLCFFNCISGLYILGNASSLPPRLPFLSPVLRMLRDKQPALPVQYIMVCCSYRGYWTSKGRPSEKGILQDAAAALKWIRDVEETSSDEGGKQPVSVIIWGQSIGAGVATNLAAQQALFSERLALKMLILETPFLSIRAMLETIYPQKWLPYRHLWPFLRNHLDSWEALGVLQENAIRHKVTPPNVVIVEAERDELVPASHGDMLERRCLELGLKVRKQSIPTALHNEVLVRPGGRTAMVEAIRQASGEAPRSQPKG
jgi:fermentation-respiration switch protein FrsA (DUF1100 family)